MDRVILPLGVTDYGNHPLVLGLMKVAATPDKSPNFNWREELGKLAELMVGEYPHNAVLIKNNTICLVVSKKPVARKVTHDRCVHNGGVFVFEEDSITVRILNRNYIMPETLLVDMPVTCKRELYLQVWSWLYPTYKGYMCESADTQEALDARVRLYHKLYTSTYPTIYMDKLNELSSIRLGIRLTGFVRTGVGFVEAVQAAMPEFDPIEVLTHADLDAVPPLVGDPVMGTGSGDAPAIMASLVGAVLKVIHENPKFIELSNNP